MLTIKNISKLTNYESYPFEIFDIITQNDYYDFIIKDELAKNLKGIRLSRIPQKVDGNLLYSLKLSVNDEQFLPLSLLSSPKTLGKHIINLLNMMDVSTPF